MNNSYLHLPPVRHLVAAAATVASLAFLPSAHAQTVNSTAVRANPSSGAFASQTYWMNWGALGNSLFSDGSSRDYSFALADGSTLSLTVTRTGTSAVQVVTRQAPTLTVGTNGVNSSMGTAGYTGLEGTTVALMSDGSISGTLSFTLSNIVLTNPANNPVANFEVVIADAEILDSADGASGKITFTTTGENWSSLERVPASGGETVILAGLGTQTAEQPAATVAGPTVVVPSWILSSAKPASGAFTVGANITSDAAQGIMLGIRMGTVRLNNDIGARLDGADQFVYRIKNALDASVGSGIDTCAAVGDCTTTGATTGNQIQISAAIANGNTVTLEEVMASGSVGTLSDYAKTIACTNTNTGSLTTLPSGAYNPASPPQITLTSAVDDISCVIANNVSADMQASGTTPQTVLPGTLTTVHTSCTNAGPQSAANATCAVTVTGVTVSGLSTTCSPVSPQTSLASGASMACTTTFTPTSTGTATLTTTAGSGVPDPTPGNNTASSTVTVSAADMQASGPQSYTATPGTQTTVSTSCTNAGPQSAANAACVVTGYPGAITTCSPSSPQVSLASGASMTCETTFTPTSAGTVTLTTTASSTTSDPTPGNNTATTTVTVSANGGGGFLSPRDDTGVVPPNGSVTLSVINNDSPATGTTLNPNSVQVKAPPAHGTVTCSAGSCTYTPVTGFNGTDSFTYEVCDNSPTPVCGTAKVTLTVGNATVSAVPVNSPWMLLFLATLLTFAAGGASLRGKHKSR